MEVVTQPGTDGKRLASPRRTLPLGGTACGCVVGVGVGAKDRPSDCVGVLARERGERGGIETSGLVLSAGKFRPAV